MPERSHSRVGHDSLSFSRGLVQEGPDTRPHDHQHSPWHPKTSFQPLPPGAGDTQKWNQWRGLGGAGMDRLSAQHFLLALSEIILPFFLASLPSFQPSILPFFFPPSPSFLHSHLPPFSFSF